jgi:hypothetical protein
MLHAKALYCILEVGNNTALIDIVLEVCMIAEHIVPALAQWKTSLWFEEFCWKERTQKMEPE